MAGHVRHTLLPEALRAAHAGVVHHADALTCLFALVGDKRLDLDVVPLVTLQGHPDAVGLDEELLAFARRGREQPVVEQVTPASLGPLLEQIARLAQNPHRRHRRHTVRAVPEQHGRGPLIRDLGAEQGECLERTWGQALS